MNFLNKHRQFIFGFILGGLIIFLLLRSMIFRELTLLEALYGPAFTDVKYAMLRNEIMDDMLLASVFFLLLAIFILLISGVLTNLFSKLTLKKVKTKFE